MISPNHSHTDQVTFVLHALTAPSRLAFHLHHHGEGFDSARRHVWIDNYIRQGNRLCDLSAHANRLLLMQQEYRNRQLRRTRDTFWGHLDAVDLLGAFTCLRAVWDTTCPFMAAFDADFFLEYLGRREVQERGPNFRGVLEFARKGGGRRLPPGLRAVIVAAAEPFELVREIRSAFAHRSLNNLVTYGRGRPHVALTSLRFDETSGTISYVNILTGKKDLEAMGTVCCDDVLGVAWRGFLGFLDALHPVLRSHFARIDLPAPFNYWHQSGLGFEALAMLSGRESSVGAWEFVWPCGDDCAGAMARCPNAPGSPPDFVPSQALPSELWQAQAAGETTEPRGDDPAMEA